MPDNDDIPPVDMESKIYHQAAIAMGMILLMLIGWIGLNVAHIPVIDEQIHDLKDFIENVVNKQIADHENRLRNLETK